MTDIARESNTRFFFRYILRHKQAYGWGIVFIFLTNWLAVSIPVYLGESIDLLGSDFETQFPLDANDDMVDAFVWALMLATTYGASVEDDDDDGVDIGVDLVG